MIQIVIRTQVHLSFYDLFLEFRTFRTAVSYSTSSTIFPRRLSTNPSPSSSAFVTILVEVYVHSMRVEQV